MNNSSRTRLVAAAAAAAIAVIAALYLLLLHESDATPAGVVWGNGRIEGTSIDIATKFPGRVAAVLVREGDDVAEGDVVARMDARALEAQLAAIQAELERTRHTLHFTRAEIANRQSQLDLAVADRERVEALFDRGNISESRVDEARAAQQSAAAALDAAVARRQETEAAITAIEARIREIETNLTDMTLRAPVSGRVEFRLAEPGEVLPAGGKVVTLINLDDLHMQVFLSERDAGRVGIGDPARIIVDAFPDRHFDAAVSFVAAEAEFTPKEVQTVEERQKLVFRTKLRVEDNRERQLKPGMPGEGYVKFDGEIPWPAKLN